MSLANIEPRDRMQFRLHGWLLMAWALAVGVSSSAALLHLLDVHSLALRYAIGAAAIYFVGFLLGGWVYAKWWNNQRGYSDDLPGHADLNDVIAYQQNEEHLGKKFKKFEWLEPFSFGDGSDPLSVLLGLLWVFAALACVVLFMGYMPILATEVLAGFLAEVVLEFVIGAVIARRVLKPRSLDAYWSVTFKKTWSAGFLLVCFSLAVGWGLQYLNPEALNIFQVFSH